MSSENQHINRQNYEEYFLLYVDNELSAAEREAVEAFAALHPDLQEELELLVQTAVLPVQSFGLEDKSFLLADSMKLNAIDDTLLLYVDDELTGEQKQRVEEMLESKPEYRQQYELLLAAKLEKETIVYPYKSDLYRHTEKRIMPYWLRIAAALIVVVALGLIFLLNGDGKEQAPLVATTPTVKENQPAPLKNELAVTTPSEKVAAAETRQEPAAKKNRETKLVIPQQEAPEQIAEVRTPVQEPSVVINPVVIADPKNNDAVVVVEPQQNINAGHVTTEQPGTYNPIGTPVNTNPDYAVTESPKNGSVRGLLRKATRFIEKRTGVNPVNDDDELLIGAIAIKLK